MNKFENRKYIILGFILLILFLYVCRLGYMQLIDESYKELVDQNSIATIHAYAPRGVITDRNDRIIVDNIPSYYIHVNPDIDIPFDTAEFLSLVNISMEELTEFLSTPLHLQKPILITANQHATLADKMYRFEAFTISRRFVRYYPYDVAGIILGYVQEVNKEDIKKNSNYLIHDNIGRRGIERYYDGVLRGMNGAYYFVKNAQNRLVASYEEGDLDKDPEVGNNMQLTLDIELQAYAEKLLQNKRGGVVAIKPKTGEILTLASAPGFSPNMLSGRYFTQNYKAISQNVEKPFYNRAIQSEFPPGSPFKLAQALVALQEGKITAKTHFKCTKHPMNCSNHKPVKELADAIAYSCNSNFYQIFKKIILPEEVTNPFQDARAGLEKWNSYMQAFGFNSKLGSDIYGVKRGNIPNVSYYDKVYGENRWAFSMIYSLAIGQGEINVTLLQLANFIATIANKGYYITPHLLKNIDNENFTTPENFSSAQWVGIDSAHFDVVSNGMAQAVSNPRGTSYHFANLEKLGIEVCAKTGTIENPHGKDHAAFVCYAPREDPEIVVAVLVENIGYGGVYAAPIASLLVEQFLTDTVTNVYREQWVLNAKSEQ